MTTLKHCLNNFILLIFTCLCLTLPLIFLQLFHEDIKYLLSMDKLWRKRKPPVPLDWDNVQTGENDTAEKCNACVFFFIKRQNNSLRKRTIRKIQGGE